MWQKVLPNISDHRTLKMSKDALKNHIINAKLTNLAGWKNKCIHPTYQRTPWYWGRGNLANNVEFQGTPTIYLFWRNYDTNFVYVQPFMPSTDFTFKQALAKYLLIVNNINIGESIHLWGNNFTSHKSSGGSHTV